jgi:hypothetical protein
MKTFVHTAILFPHRNLFDYVLKVYKRCIVVYVGSYILVVLTVSETHATFIHTCTCLRQDRLLVVKTTTRKHRSIVARGDREEFYTQCSTEDQRNIEFQSEEIYFVQ